MIQGKHILTALAALFVLACSEPQEPFPTSMQGTWVTDTVPYSNRYIKIFSDRIIMGTDSIEPHIFFIVKTSSKPSANAIEYIFTCEILSGDEFELSFIFHPDEYEPWLQLKNTPQVRWYQKFIEPDSDVF